MEVIAIIPARKGSERVPDKNKELLPFTMEFVVSNPMFNRVIITSDYSLGVIEAFRGQEWPYEYIKRTDFLSKNDARMEDVIEDVLRKTGINEGIGVLLQPTSPFRDETAIAQAINAIFVSKSEWVGSICSVRKVHKPCVRIQEDRWLEYEEHVYDEDGNFYVFRIPEDSRYLNIRQDPRCFIEQDSYYSLQVDTPREMNMFRALSIHEHDW
jgi:CMP-N-acetylneuraminic acid synthetase